METKHRAFIRQEKRAIESMKNQIVEAKRNAKSIIDGAKKRIEEAKANIKEVNNKK